MRSPWFGTFASEEPTQAYSLVIGSEPATRGAASSPHRVYPQAGDLSPLCSKPKTPMKTIIPNRYRAGLVLALLAAAISLPTQALRAETTQVTDDLGGFSQQYPPANGPFELYTQTAHSQGETYVVMVNEAGTPKVTRISEPADGTPATHLSVNLDEPDYRALNDAHNGFSIGIDKDGYIHVAGDMHGFGFVGDNRNGTPNNTAPYGTVYEQYPLRYQIHVTPESERAGIMYWVSNKPRDISAGFRFAGKIGDPQRIPGTGWSYGRFFNDKNGNLYYSARVTAADRHIGQLGVSLSSYDTTARTWSTWGEAPPYEAAFPLWRPRFGTRSPVVFWSEAGEPPHQQKAGVARNYQVYQVGFNFDENNRLHFVVSGYVDLAGRARVLYAYTDSFQNGPAPSGLGWHRADSGAISGNLLRGDAEIRGDLGTNGLMSVVYPEVAPSLEFYNGDDEDPFNDTWKSGIPNPTYITKVFADSEGRVYAKHGQNTAIWRVWDGSSWGDAATLKGNAGNIDHNGIVTTWAEWGVWRNGSTTSSTPNNVGIISPSQLGIQQTGKVYGLYKYTDPVTSVVTARVRKIAFTPAPGSGFFRQSWIGLEGRHFGALNGTAYPLSPNTEGLSPSDPNAGLFIQHTTAQATANGKIGTANRVRGHFIPPASGDYVFKVWGKFSAKLFVSTDESPLNRGSAKVLFDDNIALNTQSPILPHQWERASVSASVALVANKRYFVELVHKGASANPHVEVGATGPGFEQLPLLASRFDAWLPAPPQIHKGIEASNLTSTQATLSVLGYDDYEESALKYAWSATGPGTVSFSAQNTNAAKNCTATFSTTGTYTLTVTVTDEDGLSVSSARKIVVN